jgi:hypothetical protein
MLYGLVLIWFNNCMDVEAAAATSNVPGLALRGLGDASSARPAPKYDLTITSFSFYHRTH